MQAAIPQAAIADQRLGGVAYGRRVEHQKAQGAGVLQIGPLPQQQAQVITAA
ncbi:hypothetical protein D3C75_978480 [compost metagenome]